MEEQQEKLSTENVVVIRKTRTQNQRGTNGLQFKEEKLDNNNPYGIYNAHGFMPQNPFAQLEHLSTTVANQVFTHTHTHARTHTPNLPVDASTTTILPLRRWRNSKSSHS
jgi:hypothetical protein